jgi:hypothetical protein
LYYKPDRNKKAFDNTRRKPVKNDGRGIKLIYTATDFFSHVKLLHMLAAQREKLLTPFLPGPINVGQRPTWDNDKARELE